MPRSGGGVYTLPAGSLVTDGVDDILATQHNTPLQDIATDMNTPRPIVAGGTGAATAADARTNLGATATGSSLFTAADAAAGRTALGATAAGAAWFTAADVAAQRTLLGFAETLGFPKRQDVPGSLRQQANTVNTGAGSSVAVTFPFSFSETPLVLAIPIATGGVMLTLASVGSSGFTLQSWASNSVQAPNINCQWFAWAAK